MTQAPRSLTQRTASGVAWVTGFQVARQVLQVISISILARKVPPAAYGMVAMAALVTNFLETLRDAGIGTALVREREVSDELASTVFWLSCGLGVVVTLLVVAISFPAALFFHEPQVARILQLLSISFFLGAISLVPMAMLNRAMAFRKVALAQTAGAIFGTTVAISVALAGGKVWALVSGSVALSLATTAAIWFSSPLKVRAVFRPSDARHMLSFGLKLSGFNVLNYFSRNLDNLLVGRFLGSVPLGYYQMGYTLMTYPLQNFAGVIAQVVYPALSKFHDDHERFRVAYIRACRIIALFTFPVMMGLAVTAKLFVRVFLGAKWMPVAPLLVVLAPLGAAQAIYTTVGLIYNTQGRPGLHLRWAMFASPIYVLSFAVGLRWGILGVASCYALAWTILMVPAFLIPFRLIQLSGRTFLRSLWPTMWICLVMTVVSGVWLHGIRTVGVENPAVDLFTTVVVGAATYVALLLWRKPPVLAELAAVLSGSSYPLAKSIGRRLS